MNRFDYIFRMAIRELLCIFVSGVVAIGMGGGLLLFLYMFILGNVYVVSMIVKERKEINEGRKEDTC